MRECWAEKQATAMRKKSTGLNDRHGRPTHLASTSCLESPRYVPRLHSPHVEVHSQFNEQSHNWNHIQRQRDYHSPPLTLEQATEELWNMLTFLTNPNDNPEKALRVLGGPLKTDRCKDWMVPKRLPPRPPVRQLSIHALREIRRVPKPSSHRYVDSGSFSKVKTSQLIRLRKKFQIRLPFLNLRRKRQLHRIRVVVEKETSQPCLNDVNPLFRPPMTQWPSSRQNFHTGRFPDHSRKPFRQTDRAAYLNASRLTTLLEEDAARSSPFEERVSPEDNPNGPELTDSNREDEPPAYAPITRLVLSELTIAQKSQPSPYTLSSQDSRPLTIHELEARRPLPFTRCVTLQGLPSSYVVNLPGDIILMVMQQILGLEDLFNTAMVNRSFYGIFKQNELHLIKQTVFRMCPPAWELREMSPPWATTSRILLDPDAPMPKYTPSAYLQCYAQDICALAQLKCQILTRCMSFLRPITISGLAGTAAENASKVDDALWRIWTFCRIFGCGKGRENMVLDQIDWLQGGQAAAARRCVCSASITDPFVVDCVLWEPPVGFGLGNQDGLSLEQLYDMAELWTCLGVLLQPLHGKCTEARKFGVYECHAVPAGDVVKEEAILEEWTAYVLSLGPLAVLSLSSISAVLTTEATFEKAQDIGLTRWELPEPNSSRRSFLKEAVSRAFSSPSRRHSTGANLPGISARLTNSDDRFTTGHDRGDSHPMRRIHHPGLMHHLHRNEHQTQLKRYTLDAQWADVDNDLCQALQKL